MNGPLPAPALPLFSAVLAGTSFTETPQAEEDAAAWPGFAECLDHACTPPPTETLNTAPADAITGDAANDLAASHLTPARDARSDLPPDSISPGSNNRRTPSARTATSSPADPPTDGPLPWWTPPAQPVTETRMADSLPSVDALLSPPTTAVRTPEAFALASLSLPQPQEAATETAPLAVISPHPADRNDAAVPTAHPAVQGDTPPSPADAPALTTITAPIREPANTPDLVNPAVAETIGMAPTSTLYAPPSTHSPPAVSTPISPSTLPTPDIHADDLPARLAPHIHWLAERNIQHAHIQIAPPELGTLDIRLSLTSEHLSVHFTSQEAEVGQALQHSLPQLRQMLAEHGLQLAQADVSQHPHRQPAQGSAAADTDTRPSTDNPEQDAVRTEPPSRFLRTRHLLDAWV